MQKQKHRKTKKHQKKNKGGGVHPYRPANHYGILGGTNTARMYPSPGPRSGGFNFVNPLTAQFGGHASYPNGLVESAYNNPTNLPGVNGVQGDANHYRYNSDPTLQTRTLTSVGANRPFLKGGCGTCSLKGGKRYKKAKVHKGGTTFTGTLAQEFINAGRNIPFTFNSVYNTIRGYPPPINPSPVSGQFARSFSRM